MCIELVTVLFTIVDIFAMFNDLLARADVDDIILCCCCSVDSRFAVTLCIDARIECIETKPKSRNRKQIIFGRDSAKINAEM